MKLGKRIDAATDASNERGLKLLVDECDLRLEAASVEDQVLLYYFQSERIFWNCLGKIR